MLIKTSVSILKVLYGRQSTVGTSLSRHIVAPLAVASNFTSFGVPPRRYAGHSKWANIKHTKMAKDLQRSQEITKFITLIKVAVKEGGGTDVKSNSKLAQVISQIKAAKLPMGSFDKAIENLQARKEDKSQVISIKGIGNSIFLVEISTDNLTRTRQELNTILRKNRGIIGDDSLVFLFEHKGIILSTNKNGAPAKEEEIDQIMEDAIEAGAEDIKFVDHPAVGPAYEFMTAPSSFFKVKQALEKLGYEVSECDIDYFPKNPIELNDEDLPHVLKLHDKLSEHPNVVKVSSNIL